MRAYGPVNLSTLFFLIALNLALFIITLFRPETVYLLGLSPALVAQQPWTVLSSMFVHAGLSHILFNMISLFFLGGFLLRAVGEKSFLTVYFIGGLAGNVLFILLARPDSVGVGASGAIYALAGALAVMVPKAPVVVFPIPVPMPLWAAITIFFVISFLFPYIAWQAHLGGLLLGLTAGLIFRKRRRLSYF